MSNNTQLPVIKVALSDKELRLHLLVLATANLHTGQALDQAKEWSDWVINNKQ